MTNNIWNTLFWGFTRHFFNIKKCQISCLFSLLVDFRVKDRKFKDFHSMAPLGRFSLYVKMSASLFVCVCVWAGHQMPFFLPKVFFCQTFSENGNFSLSPPQHKTHLTFKKQTKKQVLKKMSPQKNIYIFILNLNQ